MILFTRPRRFGKTLNMSMLQYFFEDMHTDDGEKKDNAYLFEQMKIMEAGEDYLAHMGRYPVINLTLKDAKQPDFELAYAAIRRQIANEYYRHRYILQAEGLSEKKEEYLNIMRRKADRDSYNQSKEAFIVEFKTTKKIRELEKSGGGIAADRR